MTTPLHALYNYAAERGDLTHWFFDRDIADTYVQARELSEKQSSRLLADLPANWADRFQSCMDNTREFHSLETEMLFYQGLAMGRQLGALIAQV